MSHDQSRQSFLGPRSEQIFANCKAGIIGLSGGGSHIAQQLAHVGVLNYALIDPKCVEKKHLHRLVGATVQDVTNGLSKVAIAERLIKGLQPSAHVGPIIDIWQNAQVALRDCTVIFGCVDSYGEREQLERFCRRFLVPYIDIGMDVLKCGGAYRIVGQVVLSSAGWPCLQCMGIVTENNLRAEAAEYGVAGPKAQVIWPNGVLASSAVGLFVQLVAPWHHDSRSFAYLEYNGNDFTLSPSPRAEYAINQPCRHYSTPNYGDPLFALEPEKSSE